MASKFLVTYAVKMGVYGVSWGRFGISLFGCHTKKLLCAARLVVPEQILPG